ncbi:MAG: hypothetical protein WCE68_17350 [Anaerolineales bacterium]
MHTSKFAPRFVRSALIALAGLLLLVTPALAYFVPTDGQAATLVLGQPDFVSTGANTTQTGMDKPYGVAIDPGTHKVFVADFDNNRVLRFASVSALTNGSPAEAVFGQPNFHMRTASASAHSMDGPFNVFVDTGGRLWVADSINHRVLRFDHASSLASGANASAVLGQPNFTSHTPTVTRNGMKTPFGLFVDTGGRLWVADTQNDRILRYDNAAAKANGADADGVLGQPDFTSNDYATSQNGLNSPAGLAVDANGHLWVADESNRRVLRFDNAASKANGANADGVLGQPDFTSNAFATSINGFQVPVGVAVDNATGRLFVSDMFNNRILAFDSAAGLADGADASYVLGQPDFVTGTANTGGISATSLWYPSGITYDPAAQVLWVADTYNNRLLLYGTPDRIFASTSIAAQDGWVLESALGTGVGGSFSTAGTLRVGDDAANRQYRSILSFNTSALPNDAVIQSVTLKIRKAGKTGTDPLSSNIFGILLADIKEGSFGAPALQAGDFQAIPSAYQFDYFRPIGAGWYQVVLPSYDYSDIDLSGLTQFRLYFKDPSNRNNKADYDTFFAGDASAPDRPVLVIEYTLK